MANRNAKLIERTLKDFSLGAMSGNGGGSTIVDALPAQGVEGTTYLLRKKDETKVFKAQCYVQLYVKQGGTNFDLVMIDADLELFRKEITTKLNPDLSNGLVDFSFLDSLREWCKSSEEWNTLTSSNKVAIVKTEEEVSTLTEDVDYIFQDLGVIGVENFIFLEIKEANISSGTIYSLAGIIPDLNSYSTRLEKQDGMVVSKIRNVVYNSEATPNQPKYSFAEWQNRIGGPLKATLTDAYVYDQETLTNLEDGDCYLINLTPIPQEVSYSYTQYVFDQGVYTVIGGENSGRGDVINLCDYSWDTATKNSLNMFDSNSNYHFDVDAFIKYIEESGVGDIPLEPNMQGTESNGIDVIRYDSFTSYVTITSKSTGHNSSFSMNFPETNTYVYDLINEAGDTLLKFLTRNKNAIKEKFNNVSFSGSSIRGKLSDYTNSSNMCICEAWKFASTSGVYTHSMNLTKFLALFKA